MPSPTTPRSKQDTTPRVSPRAEVGVRACARTRHLAEANGSVSEIKNGPKTSDRSHTDKFLRDQVFPRNIVGDCFIAVRHLEELVFRAGLVHPTAWRVQ
jgi:hypothetical protein